ncbi:P-loop NTPase fold protein [Lentzea flaviverrucosa]|uniref:KAP family P-loop domain-containing protein n=1 Tax=Lentzea flaviverrucosa TaxID=200379 RepID=A0A1H9FAK3_9PSEU|nr:P-loop NTPase fold protein [Lentzea flaviverrucosa]RDI35257.1 KAP-like P-loop domain-containing protein [Lentzea flaviverrucosa]SEQ34885.1 KAP family P-loop domain-containing protein [Lentzea flaviverrucosa]
MSIEIFISHAPDGAEDAEALTQLVEKSNDAVRVISASTSDDLFVRIGLATIVIVIVTPDYLGDETSRHELSVAEDIARRDKGLSIVLLVAEDSVPDRLRRYPSVPFTRPVGREVIGGIVSVAGPREMPELTRQPAPFIGRAEELRTLVDWCGSAARHSGAMVFGLPGTGRTRLANELCAQMRADGWNAGFNGDPGVLSSSASRTLVVIDHADIAPIARVLALLDVSAHDRTRVLLLGQDEAPSTLWDQVLQAEPDAFPERPPVIMSLNQRRLSPRDLRDLEGSHHGTPLTRAETPLEHLLAASLHRGEDRDWEWGAWPAAYFAAVTRYWRTRLVEVEDLPEKPAARIVWIAAMAGLRPNELGSVTAELTNLRLHGAMPTGWSVLPAPDGTTLLEHELVVGHAAHDNPEGLREAFNWALGSPGRLAPFLERMAAAALARPPLRKPLVELLGRAFNLWPLAAQQNRAELTYALSMCISVVAPTISPELAEEWRNQIGEVESASTVDFLGTGDQWAREDALNRGAWINALVTMVKPPAAKPLDRDGTGPSVIAVDGPWGAGKTSLMGIVRKRLDDLPAPPASEQRRRRIRRLWAKRWLTLAGAIYLLWRKPENSSGDQDFPAPVSPITVWFNPWAHQSSDQVWAGMARSILDAVSEKLFATEHERARYWLRRNGSRLDRGRLRRSLLRNALSPLVKLAVLSVAVPVGAALLRYDRSIDVLGVHVASGATLAKWVAAVLVAAAVVDTLRRFFFGRAANWCPAGLLDGPVLSGALAQPGADSVLRDPLYHARSGYLYLLQHDIHELLQDAAAKRHSVVVFVDDLDRCNPKTACEVLEAVNLFLSEDFPATKFVLGLDMGVVAAQIDQVMKDFTLEKTRRYFDDPSPGWTFLRKLVQLPVLLPRIERSTMESMVTRFLGTVIPVAEEPAAPAPPPAEPRATEVRTGAAPQRQQLMPAQPATGQEEPGEAPVDLAKLERHPAVRQRVQERLDTLPVQSAREAKRLLTVWQFYLRVLSAGGSPAGGTDQVVQAKAVVLLAELVVRWPALSAQLFGVVDGEQGVTRLRAAAPRDDVEWARAAAKVGLDPKRDKEAAKSLRELLTEQDSHLLAALSRRLL